MSKLIRRAVYLDALDCHRIERLRLRLGESTDLGSGRVSFSDALRTALKVGLGDCESHFSKGGDSPR